MTDTGVLRIITQDKVRDNNTSIKLLHDVMLHVYHIEEDVKQQRKSAPIISKYKKRK